MIECILERERQRARIVLGRPDMTTEMAAGIVEYLDELDQDDDIKVVLISGSAGVLSTGRAPEQAWASYLEEPGGAVRKHPSQRARLTELAEHWWGPHGLYNRLLHCRKVTIVEASGDCFETGLYLSLCADLVVARTGARFGCPRWRNLGVDGDLSLLIASVGLKRTKELMFSGRVWNAEQAQAYGLLDHVADDPETQITELADMCASIMRDGIVTEKYAVFPSLAKMGVDYSFHATTVVGASLSNIHFQPGEYNFLRDQREHGSAAAIERSRRNIS